MFVHVMVRNGEPARICDGIIGVVQMAVEEVLGSDAARIFVHVTSGVDDPKRVRSSRVDEIRVAILILAAGRLRAAKKRRLFGRIAEISYLELKVAHDQIVTGIIEMPRENWSNGYDERQWLQYLGYQLP